MGVVVKTLDEIRSVSGHLPADLCAANANYLFFEQVAGRQVREDPYLVALDSAGLVGALWTTRAPSALLGRREAVYLDLVVALHGRGRGVGSTLLEIALARLGGLGADFPLLVVPTSRDGVALATKAGFYRLMEDGAEWTLGHPLSRRG